MENIMSLEIKTSDGISIFTVGRTPIQNQWATNWKGIIDEIYVSEDISNSEYFDVKVYFIDGRSLSVSSKKIETMFVTAKDGEDLYNFRDKEKELERIEMEEEEEKIKYEEKREQIMPVNL